MPDNPTTLDKVQRVVITGAVKRKPKNRFANKIASPPMKGIYMKIGARI